MDPPNPRRAFVGLSALGLILGGLMWVLVRSGDQLVARQMPWIEALTEHRLEVQLALTAFEQELHSEQPDSYAITFQHLARARDLAQTLADGGSTSLGPLQPLGDPVVRSEVVANVDDIDVLGVVLAGCLGSDGCASEHATITRTVSRIDYRGRVAEQRLRQSQRQGRARYTALRNATLVASWLLAIGVGLLLATWERAWKRSFALLQSYIQRLGREVKERRQVEGVLRESETRFRVMADGAPMLMWVSDADMHLSFVNHTWTDFVGRPAETQLGDGWKASVFPSDQEDVDRALRVGKLSRAVFQIEFRMRRSDGEYRWVLMRGVPRTDDGGVLVGFIGSCMDITGRRRAEDALRDSEGRFRAMAEAAYDPVILVDEAGRITHWNRAAEKTFGYPVARVLGRGFVDMLVPEARREEALAFFSRLRADSLTTQGDTVELGLLDRDARLVPVALSIAALSLGGRWHAVVIGRDVTERVRRDAVGRLLRDVTEAIVEGQPVETMLSSLCGGLAQAFGFDDVWIALGSGPEQPRVMASSGDGAAALPPEAGGALQEGRVQVSVTEPQAVGVAAAPEDRPPKASAWVGSIAIPIADADHVVGVLAIRTGRPDLVERRVLGQLEELARQVGVALVRSRDQQQLRLHGTALSVVANAIFIMGSDERILWVNPAMCELSGYSQAELVGQSPSLLRSGAHPRSVYQGLWDTVHSGRIWRGELIERRKDGGVYTVYQTVTPLADESQTPTHFIAVQTDVTAQREVERRLRHMALHDDLTGLANRSLFIRHLRRAIAGVDRGGGDFAVLFLDLDHFKDVNDTLGHAVGDQLLREVASVLVRTVRPADTVARFGGDEFAILQTGVKCPGDAATLARKIIETLDQPFVLGEHSIHTSASVGVAVHGPLVDDPEALLVQADTALYKSKEEGRATFSFHTERMQREVVDRVRLTQELRRAIERDELRVFYQPQVDIDTGRLIGMEALVRWQHPRLGLLPPGRFISVAEDSGSVVALGRAVLRQVCEDAASWRALGLYDQPVAVNLSPVQFKVADLAGQVLRVLEVTGLPASSLELEITESVLMQTSDRADETLRELHSHGVCLAIDDFGTGYSSLQYLRRFPISRLKIAQEFVRHLVTDGSDAAIVSAVIGLARSLGVRVIAEGVETLDQVEFLRRAGCVEAQGFYYYKPLSLDAVVEALKAESRRVRS